MLTIEARAVGRRRPVVPQWHVPMPPTPAARGEPLTLRTLIAAIVADEVVAARQRRDQRRLTRVLSDWQIEAGVAAGRILPGERDLEPSGEVDEAQAIGTALQAFEDGLYLVFIDGREHRDLDEQVFPGPDSVMTFLRLVALAGA